MSIYIIAEAGVNHNGSYETACRLADAAKNAGADCVKFQTFKAENLVSQYAAKAEYQKQTTDSSESQLDMIKKLELSYEQFRQLEAYCKKIGIEFISTPFDMESIAFLNTFDMPFWKVPSGEITNLPYLTAIAKTNKPVIMSTGMCESDEITAAVKVLRTNGTDELTLLHCNTEYPTPFSDVNLRVMEAMRRDFGVAVGYSDHTAGIEIPIAAAAMGATVIEKHFTLDRSMEGPDHKASLTPGELAQMVLCIRNVEAAMGDGIKAPSASERKNIEIARKSIVALKKIHAGEAFTENNITAKRPGNGVSPMRWFEVLGRTAKRDFAEDELIEL